MRKTGHKVTQVEYKAKQYKVHTSLGMPTQIDVCYWHPRLMRVERCIWHRFQERSPKVAAIIAQAFAKREASGNPL